MRRATGSHGWVSLDAATGIVTALAVHDVTPAAVDLNFKFELKFNLNLGPGISTLILVVKFRLRLRSR